MKNLNIAVSQRVDITESHAERRDALDQRWPVLLNKLGCISIPMPNHIETINSLWTQIQFDGLLLTGGNDLVSCGGNSPERDEAEAHLLALALEKHIPVLAVCRGMQLLLNSAGHKLVLVDNHVGNKHALSGQLSRQEVNSYHKWSCIQENVAPYTVLARAPDGAIEVIQDSSRRVMGIMWHPERNVHSEAEDVQLIRSHFGIKP